MNPNPMLRTATLVLPVFALAIDAASQHPGVEWSTFLGGSGYERTAFRRGGALVAGDGDVLVWGSTTSPDFPTKNAFDSTYNGAGAAGYGDAWIARLKADGSDVVWSTLLGGKGDETVFGLAVEPSGVITVSGWTSSPAFPTTQGAFDETYNGAGAGNIGDAFVARFAWNGRKLDLLWSTFLGAGGDENAFQLAVHPSGAIVVGGWTESTAFPIRGTPFQNRLAGKRDLFVAVLSPDGCQLLSSTFLGGSGDETIQDLTLDIAGNPIVSGYTDSANFPTTAGAFQRVRLGLNDGFVSRLDPALARLTYSTLLGGTGRTAFDTVSQVEITPANEIVAAGGTASADFPVTAGAYDTTFDGSTDGFVALLDPQRAGAAQLRWSTFLGGSLEDGISSLGLERSGMVTVAGWTSSLDFPTTKGAHQTTHRGGTWDAFVTRLDPSRTQVSHQLLYSTLLGGSEGYDLAHSLALDASGNAVVTGPTASTSFLTTPGCFDPTYNGGMADVFVSKLTMLPKGVERFGSSTPACIWPMYQGVNSWPRRGNPGFAMHVNGAAPNAQGVIVVGPLVSGYRIFNVWAFVNPMVVLLPVAANSHGYSRLALPLPGSLAVGTKIGLQWALLTSTRCPGTGPFSTSEAVELTIQ